jgi:hypothetical protein
MGCIKISVQPAARQRHALRRVSRALYRKNKMMTHGHNPYWKTLFLVSWTMILLHSPLVVAYGDSGGCPGEEMHRSPNGVYYLNLLPKGACYEPDYKLEWTYGKTSGPVYFHRNGFYPTDVSISNDGDSLVLAGNYVHNLLGKVEEGLWLYNRSGDLIRHIDSPFVWPKERSVSSLWWFSRSYLSSGLGIYILTSTDGVRRIYKLSNGKLVLVLPALWQVLSVVTVWIYVLTSRKVYPRSINYVQMVRERIAEKKLGSEAIRQARILLKVCTYSLLSAALAAIFLGIGYFVYPVLVHIFVGDETSRFKSHIGLFDADFWFRMTVFEVCVFFLVHLIIGVFVSEEMSSKRSLTTAASFAIMFLLVMVDTSAFYYPILFLPIAACTFLFWPRRHLQMAKETYS